jgi:tricorn protease
VWRLHDNGHASSVVTGYGLISEIASSPDGMQIVFTSDAEGGCELFVHQQDGPAKRLTFFGLSRLSIAGWAHEGLFVRSRYGTHAVHTGLLYKVCTETGLVERVNLGHSVNRITQSKSHVVAQRYGYGYASWRGYRGGTKGELWIGEGLVDTKYSKLIELEHNIIKPTLHKDRVYFLNEACGVGNVYSCDLSGKDIKQHTNCSDYYVRDFCFVGDSIYYISGGKLYTQDKRGSGAIDVQHGMSASRRVSLTSEGVDYLDDFCVSKDQSMLLTIRGRLYRADPGVAAVDLSATHNSHYYTAVWLDEKSILGVTCDHNPEVYRIDQGGAKTKLPVGDPGVVHSLTPSKDGKSVLMTNNRHELWLWSLENEFKATKIVASSKLPISRPNWSPDGEWIAYSHAETYETGVVKLYNVKTAQTIDVTSPTGCCRYPAFSADGKYLVFVNITSRNHAEEFEDIPGNSTQYTYELRLAMLDADADSPLDFWIKKPEDKDEDKGAGKNDKKDAAESEIKVVISDGLSARIQPVAAITSSNRIYPLLACDKNVTWFERAEGEENVVKQHEWATQKTEALASKVNAASYNNTWAAYLCDTKLITVKSGEKLSESPESVTPQGGGLWSLPVVHVDTRDEWRTIYTQAWYLMKEHFYTGKDEGVDWDALYHKYLPLVDMATSRDDVNDIIYEFKGELRSSHAFVLSAGDVDKESRTALTGSLMADITWDGSRWILNRCYGDRLYGDGYSPLRRFGLKPGTSILKINGIALSAGYPPERALIGLVGTVVSIEVEYEGKKRTIRTKISRYDSNLSDGTSPCGLVYKEWVAKNSQIASDAGFGYVHIPDMGEVGLNCFYDAYKHVYDRPGLIIDLRNNCGGNVSTIILSTLLRKRLGVDLSKYHGSFPYMIYSPRGPMVVLANQYTASDGDIFTQAFRDMKLGVVVGKRTWGGVIGIMPRYKLIDNGLTSQPEFAYKFDSVGFDVEGGGVAPDVEVENDLQEVEDKQLDVAIQELRKLVK